MKSKTADKVLSIVREEIISLIDNDESVLDVGCGTGDFLFKALDKIRFGVGIDLDSSMIRFANNNKKALGVENVEFIQGDINSLQHLSHYNISVATSTLCLHEMQEGEGVKALKLLSGISSRILIADYSRPKSIWSQLAIELDEMVSGHYGRFRAYRNNGHIPYLADLAGLKVSDVKETSIDGILIWQLNQEN